MPQSALANPDRDGSGSDHAFTIERLIPAPIARVFEAWTDPALLAQWWGPEGATTPEVAMDLRPGGRWRTVMVGGNGDRYFVSGAYRAIEPPSRLVFTWGWEDETGARGHESEVEVRFTAAGAGTHLAVTHRRLESAASAESHRAGWTSGLRRLEEFAAG